MISNFIDKAIKFAGKKHSGMIRKGDGKIYFYHPLEALIVASSLTDDEDILAACVLHDVVEDTPATIEEILKEFNPRVAKLVASESEDKRGNKNKADTWKERKEEAIDKVRNAEDIGTKIITLSDKISNLRSLHSVILKKGDATWDAFNMKDPLMHYWYYDSLREAFSELKDTAAYQEYCYLLNEIFGRYLNKGEKHEQ